MDKNDITENSKYSHFSVMINATLVKKYVNNKKKFTEVEISILDEFISRTKTGARSELEKSYNLELSDSKWGNLEMESTRSECQRCPYSHTCTTVAHRDRFKEPENDLIITNHNQYIASVNNMLAEIKRSPIVPVDPGVLIIDEAHHFMENFLGMLENSFTILSLEKLTSQIHHDFKGDFKKSMDKMRKVLDKNKMIVEEKEAIQGRYPIPPEIKVELLNIENYINESINKYESTRTFKFTSNQTDVLEEWLDKLSGALDEDYVSWIQYDFFKISTISKTFPSIFRKTMDYITRFNKVIVMSGTLTNDGNFDSIIQQWRLKKEKLITKVYKSPFDYENQALIYIPSNLPLPKENTFINEGLKVIDSLIKTTEGRALVLSTSREHMNLIGEYLQPKLQEQEITALLQGERGVESLTREFKEDEKSVLVGTGSFFSGFSISGRALISVILTKLPFPNKDDPFLKLIGQGYDEKDFFNLIIFPEMINKLNQAMGRLIRSIGDYGVFTVMDKRVYTEKYGEDILRLFSTLGYKVTRSLEEVENFFEVMRENGSNAKYVHYDRRNIKHSNVVDVPLNDEEKPIKRQFSKRKTAKRTRSKKDGVTKAQREYVQNLCQKEGIDVIKSTYTNELYQKVIDYFYFEWRDEVVECVRGNFPYRNEVEEEKLSNFKGKERRRFMPYCKKYGCLGDCLKQEDIVNYFKEKYDVEDIHFRKRTGDNYCLISPSELSILDNEEFRPEKTD